MTYLEALIVTILTLAVIGGPLVFAFFSWPRSVGGLLGGNGVLGRAIALALLFAFLPLILLAALLYVGWKIMSRFFTAVVPVEPAGAIVLVMGPLLMGLVFLEFSWLYFDDTARQIVQVEEVQKAPFGDRIMIKARWELRKPGLILQKEFTDVGEDYYVVRGLRLSDFGGKLTPAVASCLKRELAGARYKTAVLERLRPDDAVRFVRQLTELKIPEDPFPLDIYLPNDSTLQRLQQVCGR